MSETEFAADCDAGGVLRLAGVLDVYSAAALCDVLKTHLAQPQPGPIDLARVERCDLAGLQLLISARRTATAQAKPLYFLPVPQPLHEALSQIGVAARLLLPEEGS